MEKTTNYNPAEGRGESQEDQPTPQTNQKNGLEGRQGKAEELYPTRKVGKSEPEDNPKEKEGNQQVCHKKMARDNPSYEGSQDRHRTQSGIAPGAIGWRKKGRERERSGPRRMKRRTGDLERQTEASRKGTVH